MAMELLRAIDESQASIQALAEERDAMARLAPLNVPLELLTGISGLEIFVAETSKANKVQEALGDLAKDCEVLARDRIVAVACRPAHAPKFRSCSVNSGQRSFKSLLARATPESVSLRPSRTF